jgi:hypothetical protein
MPTVLRAAMAYLGVVFAVAFCLGALRMLVVVPRIGEIPAVLIEVPLLLALSWVVAGAVLRRWPLPGAGARAAMGGLAFAGLMALELALGRIAFGQPLAASLAALATPAGLIGLAGQLGFGLVPLLRPQASG